LAAVAALLFSTRFTVAEEFAELSLDDAAAAAAVDEPPPLPFHSIEGVGGGAITPMAYLVNPGDECHAFGKPAVAMSFVGFGEKNLTAITVTETLFQRVELGYAANRLGLGDLPGEIHDFSEGAINNSESDIWLHHFNVRALLVKENAGDLPLPAVTAGVHFKVNGTIRDIDEELGGALTGIGLRSSSGVDYTLTATKTIPPDVLGRPLILTAGLRLSKAANLGFLGFGDEYRPTFEGSVAFLPLDRVLVAYEFRQKADPYGRIPGVDQRRRQLARLRRGPDPEQQHDAGRRVRHLRDAGQP
jgi:hypothetical protein